MAVTTEKRSSEQVQNHDVCQPSLENFSPKEWKRYAQIAYLFARHARHDLANIHCALGMFDLIESMHDPNDATPLPPELQPDQIKVKCKQDIKQLVSVSTDLVLISQAASTASCQPIHKRSVSNLIENAVLSRLAEDHPVPSADIYIENDTDNVVAFGDQLAAALSVFYFQWTPWLNPHQAASGLSIRRDSDRVIIEIPTDDTESVAGFARRLHSTEASPIASIVDRELSITTAELALWMARFVTMVHGGTVNVDPNDPQLTLRITLPLVD